MMFTYQEWTPHWLSESGLRVWGPLKKTAAGTGWCGKRFCEHTHAPLVRRPIGLASVNKMCTLVTKTKTEHSTHNPCPTPAPPNRNCPQSCYNPTKSAETVPPEGWGRAGGGAYMVSFTLSYLKEEGETVARNPTWRQISLSKCIMTKHVFAPFWEQNTKFCNFTWGW